MRTSISRFVRQSRLGFWVFALFAISALGGAPVARAQSSGQSQDQKSGQSSQSQSNDQDRTPSAQTGKSQVDNSQPDAKSKNKKNEDPPESRLRITVLGGDPSKPVGSASVYIRYPDGKTFFTHKDKEAEENFKTNQDGTVKVPSVPRGRILIQVIAPGWHTYGKYYDIDKDEVDIEIKLDKPPRWY